MVNTHPSASLEPELEPECLTSITIPECVTSIELEPELEPECLTSITIPECVTSIELEPESDPLITKSKVLTKFPYSDFSEQVLQGKRFNHFFLYKSNFTRANCGKIQFYNADARKTDFTEATLTQSYCWFTNFTGAVFRCACMTYAKLSSANFTSAQLNYANLEGAILFNANLTGATLTGANLKDANLTGANLKDAILTGVSSGGIRGTPKALPSGYKITNGYLSGPDI
jgi:uncharacterized protein YjbI with pentapeptide repeats